MALLLKLSEQIESIIPADAQWSMSENLRVRLRAAIDSDATITYICIGED